MRVRLPDTFNGSDAARGMTMSLELARADYRGDLGDGLIRRWSTPADTERIAHFMGSVWRNSAEEPPLPLTLDQGRMIMRPDFPFMGPTDFALIEATSNPGHPIIACTCFWRHRWRYGGIEFGVGRPENVGSDVAYRHRGLVRALFEMVHARSAAEGHLLQAITGIPYFYRQFGYEYVLDLEAQRITYFSLIPEKPGDAPEPYSLRLATLDDLPLVMRLYERRRTQSLVWHEAPEAYWRFVLNYWHEPEVRTRNPATVGLHVQIQIITHPEHGACGFVALAARRWRAGLPILMVEVSPEVDLPTALPSLLRLLRTVGEQTPRIRPEPLPCSEILWNFGRQHPLYALLGNTLAPRQEQPYAWYIRVPDLVKFLQHVTPVLDERLAHSVYANYSGEVRFDLYRSGFALRIERGRLVGIDPWRPPPYDDQATLGCPPLVFLQVVLGYRSMEELNAFYPDAWIQESAAPLVNTLFPVQDSTVYPLL
jgi:hypothetical protein